jgi:hypothetical protein
MKKYLVSAFILYAVAGGASVASAAFSSFDVSAPVTASQITAKTPTTFSAVYTNKGSDRTFSENIFFDIRPSPYVFSGLAFTPQTTVPPLDAGKSTTASRTYTFPSAGTYNVRACYGDLPSTFDQRAGYTSMYDYPCGPAKTVTVGGDVETSPTDPRIMPLIVARYQGYENFCFIKYTQTQCNMYIGWDLGNLPEGGQAGAWRSDGTLFSNQSKVFKLTTVTGDGSTFHLKDASGNIISSVYARAHCMDYGYQWINGACRKPATGLLKVNGDAYNGTTCTIQAGQSRCNVTVSYTTENATNASVWAGDKIGNPTIGTSNAGFTWGWATVNPAGGRHPNNILSLHEGTTTNGKLLSKIEFEGKCAYGTEWVVDKCLSVTSNTLSVNGGFGDSTTQTECVIPVGGTTCKDVVVKWATTYPTASVWLIYGTEAARKISSSLSGSTTLPSSAANVRHGTNIFKFVQGSLSTGALIKSVTVTAKCASGSSLNSSGGCVSATNSTDPDLTAGSITPVTASGNVETTFSSVISNLGAGSAAVTSISNSLVVRFETAKDAQGRDAAVMPYNFHHIQQPIASSGKYTAQAKFTLPVSGTVYMRACVDIYAAVSESNETNNCGSWTAITVSGTQSAADLTSSAITPITATVNTPVTLYSTITKTGAGVGLGIGYSTRFEWSLTSNGSDAKLLSTDIQSTNDFSTAGTNRASIEYTPLSAGTYYVRACTDSGSAITESNENNNCGPWTAVVVQQSQASITSGSGTISASPCVILSGNSTCSVTVRWNMTTPQTGGQAGVWVRSAEAGSQDILFSSNSTGSSTLRNISKAGGTIYLRGTNGANLASVVVNPACTSGKVWNGNICTTAPTINGWIKVNGQEGDSVVCSVSSNSSACTANVTWETNATSPTLWDGNVLRSNQKIGSGSTAISSAVGVNTKKTFYLRNGTTTVSPIIDSVEVTAPCQDGTILTNGACIVQTNALPAASTTGTLSLSGCSPTHGTKSCLGYLSWTSNLGSGFRVTTIENGTEVTGNAANGGKYVTLNRGNNEFKILYNGKVLATKTLAIECVSTAPWNGTLCMEKTVPAAAQPKPVESTLTPTPTQTPTPTSPTSDTPLPTQTVEPTQTQTQTTSPISTTPPRLTLRSDGRTVREGANLNITTDSVVLTWKSPDATSCSFKGEVLEPTGTKTFSGMESKSYTFTCSNSTGSSAITFTVTAPVPVSESSVLGTSTSCTALVYNLHRGHESKNVRALQEFLYTYNLLDEVTGFYGDKTIAAVKAYQKSKGLPQTGMVWNLTRAAIASDSCN